MSKPTTPASRQRTAHSATSTERAAWRMAVTSERIDDGVAGGRRPLRADPEALEDRLLDLVEGQAPFRAQLRRHADLGVDDAVGGEVLGALGGDPDDRVALLHDPDRVGEGLEVELEATCGPRRAGYQRGERRPDRWSAGRRSRTRRRGR